MKKITNLVILGSVLLILTGMVMFVITLSINKWDFKTFVSGSVSTNTYEITDKISNIIIDESECDINIIYTDDETSKVVVKEESNRLHIVEVNEDTLTIKEEDNRAWFEKLFDFYDTEMTIYINNNLLDDLNIDTSTGDIKVSDKFTFNNVAINGSTADVLFNAKVIENIKIHVNTGDIKMTNVVCANADLELSTGDIEIENLNCNGDLKIEVSTGESFLKKVICKNFYSTGSTGELFLSNVIVSYNMEIQRNTGDVKFDRCDAGNIVVETSTGDVTGTFLTNKIFIIDTSTGDKKVPESNTGGKCKITTSTGDVVIDIVNN